MSRLVTGTAPHHDWESLSTFSLWSVLGNDGGFGSDVVRLIVVVQVRSSMSVLSALTVGVNIPAVVDIGIERDINELISPAMHLLTVLVIDLSLKHDSGVAPSPIRSMAHVVPVNSEGTDSDGSPQTVIVVLSGEVSVGVRPELDASRAVVLPSLTSMSSLVTLTSEEDWCEHQNRVAAIVAKSVGSNLVDLVVVVYPIRGVTVVSILRH
jgi:hypothetical protein